MQAEDKIKSSKERLFDVYYALHRDNLDEAEGHLQKIRSNNLGRVSRLRYFTLAGEIKLKQQEPKEAQEYLLRGLDEAVHNSMDSGLMDQVNYLLGKSYYDMGQYLEAYKIHKLLLYRHIRRDPLRLALSNSVGMEMVILGNVYSPLEYFRESINLGQALIQPVQVARACLGRAICYMQIGKYQWSLLHAQRGLQLLKDSQNWDLLAKLHNVIAQVLILGGQAAQAQTYQQKAIEYAKKAGDKVWLSTSYAVMGQALAAQSRWEEARQIIALAEATSTHNNIYLAYSLTHYAAILNRHGHEAEADQTFQRSFYYLKDSGDAGTALAANYYSYGQLLANRGQYQQAVQVLRQALEIQQIGRQKTA